MTAPSPALIDLANTTPETSAAYRCLLAVPLLAALWWFHRPQAGPAGRGGRSWLSTVPSDHLYAVVAGVFLAVDLILWHRSIFTVGVGVATMLTNLQVVLVAAIAWIAFDERPSRRFLIALPGLLVGVLLLSGVIEQPGFESDPLAGTAFGIGSAAAFAVVLILIKGRGQGSGGLPYLMVTEMTAVAGLVCLVAALALGRFEAVPPPSAITCLAITAISSHVVAWLLISSALPRLRASTGSVLFLLQPIGAILIGLLFLSQQPATLQLLGAILIGCSIVVATTGPPAAKAPA